MVQSAGLTSIAGHQSHDNDEHAEHNQRSLPSEVAAATADAVARVAADVAAYVAAAGVVAGGWVAVDPVSGGWATSWPQSYAIRAVWR